ncbi:hypothetical protein GGR44_000545 [Sphingobium fontiphilum]|uniref:Uncharacterized protein n=1 Tax=Sphingobium fontiphilum TaxID=944425 RepID=A0A7W6GPD7_9SPHN|nr:hypothetical protein [Sphingobium fontiphilum]MBB3980914.1 hypothetical protein [Sphingobium fontiphilum]
MSFVLFEMSFAVLGPFGTIAFMALQGALVWLLAKLVARSLGVSHWAAKAVLITASWLVWVTGGIFVWSLMGGSGGMFDGGMPVLVVIPTGIYGAALAALLWIFMKPRKLGRNNG